MAEEKRKGTEGLEPYVLAMVVCDQVYEDPATHKRSLLGIFSEFTTARLPLRVRTMAVFLAITDCRGKSPFQIRLIDANEQNEPLFEAEGEIESHDARVIVEMVIRMRNIVFPAAGEYRFQFSAYGTLLMERRIFVRHLVRVDEKKENY